MGGKIISLGENIPINGYTVSAGHKLGCQSCGTHASSIYHSVLALLRSLGEVICGERDRYKLYDALGLGKIPPQKVKISFQSKHQVRYICTSAMNTRL